MIIFLKKHFKKFPIIGVFGLNLINSFVLAVIFIFIANRSGPENFGIFTFIFTISSFPPIFAGLGSENVLVMYASRTISDLPIFFGNAIAIRFFVSVLILLIFIILSIFITYDLKLILFLSLFSSLLNSFFTSLYLSVFRIIGLHVKSVSYLLLGTILFAIIIFLSPKSVMTPSYVIISLFISNIFIFIFFTIDILKKIKPIFSYYSFLKFKTIGFKFSLSQLFDLFFQKSDIIFLNILVGGLFVGLYSASNRVISVFVILPSALQFVFLQEFHKYSNNFEQLRNLFKKQLYIIIEFSVIIIGFVYWNSPIIINTLYNNKFSESYILLRLLSIAFVINFIGYPYSMQAEALGLVGARLKIRVITLVFMILFFLILIPRYNVIGAAISIILGNLIFILQLHYAAFKNFNLKYNNIIYILKIFTIFLITGLIITSLNNIINYNNIFKICLTFFIHVLLILILDYNFKIFKIFNFFKPNDRLPQKL
jgi:O-antigen/teichoic acid export membrane protein